MGLITEFVEVDASGRYKEYYRSLGYEIPIREDKYGRIFTKRGEKITIKVEDLTEGSNVYVDVRCDGICNNVKSIQYFQYVRGLKTSNKKYYCRECNGILFSSERTLIDRLKKSISFKDWCIREKRTDLLERWDYRLNKYTPDELCHGSVQKIYFKCPAGIHKSKVFSMKEIKSKLSATCEECESVGYLFPDSTKVWSKENKKSPFQYRKSSNVSVIWKCPLGKHEEYKRKVFDAVNCEFRCPECTRERIESIMQEKARKYIESFGYEVKHEQHCSLNPNNPIIHKTAKQRFKLRYDNEIIISNNHRVFCEVNGQQHEKVSDFHKKQAKKNGTTPEYEFKYGKQKDAFKKKYVLEHGYTYIAISYKLDTKDEPWKKIIDNAIAKELRKIKKESKNT